MPQLNRGLRWSMRFMAVGLSLFALGLFKKVIVADGLAPMAEAAFHATDSGKVIASSSAWAGMLSYTLELYYDFSGYSDMACGLALLFGIRLPINFFSPYKSSSIIEFWRRWHMTLSRFLRDYVYFSLGGNRKGRMRTNINLLATMILGGFWHGASWTFAIWGAYHDVLLLINHAWRRIDAADDGASAKAVRRYPSIAVTFLAVSLGWILFKSATIAGAGRMFRSLVVDGDTVPQALDIGDLSQIVAALIAVWLLPNSFQIFRRYNPAVGRIPIFSRVFEWRPSIAWAFAIACCGAMALMTNRPKISFLYFQF
jgi:D-alanyl-lipoteichoic acid acyltransferase DltB (MBOAT superfamily)